MSEEKEVCINCVHCHQTKELCETEKGREWIKTYICTLWLDLGEEDEPLLLTLGDKVDRPRCDLCECIKLKEKENE